MAVGERREPSRIGVLGLWHLGCVTAACLAEAGFDVVGFDPDSEVIAKLRSDRPPVAEPGLSELISEGRMSGRLMFESADATPVLSDLAVIWIAFDTPVDADDHVDSDAVIDQAHRMLLPRRSGDQGDCFLATSGGQHRPARVGARGRWAG